jgi:hypothetical protein
MRDWLAPWAQGSHDGALRPVASGQCPVPCGGQAQLVRRLFRTIISGPPHGQTVHGRPWLVILMASPPSSSRLDVSSSPCL